MTANHLGQSVWAFSNTTLLSTDEDMTRLCLGGRRDCLLVIVEPRMRGLRPIGAEWARDQSMGRVQLITARRRDTRAHNCQMEMQQNRSGSICGLKNELLLLTRRGCQQSIYTSAADTHPLSAISG